VLFDDIAAFVKENINFGEGFTESSVTDPSIGLTVGNISGNSDYDTYYEFEKDVLFNSGDFKMEVNGGGNGERYILKQGSATIFDTVSKWDTKGTAYTWDFDRFDINFAPGSVTTFTFTPQSRGDGQDVRGNNGTIGKINPETLISDDSDDIAPPTDNGVYDNKNKYLSNLGLSDDGSATGIQSYLGTKFTNQGQINTGQATGETTKLTLRVEADSIFQIRAAYSTPTTPSNYVDVGDASTGSVTLDPVGLGLLQNVSIATANDAASAVSSLAKEIEGIGAQLATLGANLSELDIAGERLNNQVYLSEAGISRLTSDVMATESTELAKQQIRLQSSQALMAQAFSLSENILSTLL
jgi:flagellin-like hook-associated protein FlgL